MLAPVAIQQGTLVAENILADLATNCLTTREYARAQRYASEARSLAPDDPLVQSLGVVTEQQAPKEAGEVQPEKAPVSVHCPSSSRWKHPGSRSAWYLAFPYGLPLTHLSTDESWTPHPHEG